MLLTGEGIWRAGGICVYPPDSLCVRIVSLGADVTRKGLAGEKTGIGPFAGFWAILGASRAEG